MRVLVSGPHGFLGKHLVASLVQNGHTVVALSRSSIEEITSTSTLIRATAAEDVPRGIDELENIDAVVHCATLYRRQHRTSEISSLVESNLTLGITLAELATRQSARFVNISTFFQHEEGKPHNPISLYASLKDAMSDITEFYVRRQSLNAIDLYLYNNFGPGDDRDKVVPLIVRACKQGESLSLRSPDALINLMYVGDVVAAVNRAIESSILGRYSVASKNVVSIRTLVSMVEEAFGRTVEVKWTDPDGVPEPPIPSLYPSLPDWSPTWTLEQGLRELRDSLQ